MQVLLYFWYTPQFLSLPSMPLWVIACVGSEQKCLKIDQYNSKMVLYYLDDKKNYMPDLFHRSSYPKFFKMKNY